jgi:hypothetical protein
VSSLILKVFNVRAISKKNGMRKTSKSSLHRYNIFEQCKTDVNDFRKFFYLIDGGMILHRLKRQTAKIKIDLLMFFAKNWPKIIFSVVKQKMIPHVAVVQEDIDVNDSITRW